MSAVNANAYLAGPDRCESGDEYKYGRTVFVHLTYGTIVINCDDG